MFEEDKGCNLAQATITSHLIDVYTITCDIGYELNYNVRYYKCIDGTLRPMADIYTLDSSATDPAKCVLGKYRIRNQIIFVLSYTRKIPIPIYMGSSLVELES